jgi:hypothetical protein
LEACEEQRAHVLLVLDVRDLALVELLRVHLRARIADDVDVVGQEALAEEGKEGREGLPRAVGTGYREPVEHGQLSRGATLPSNAFSTHLLLGQVTGRAEDCKGAQDSERQRSDGG